MGSVWQPVQQRGQQFFCHDRHRGRLRVVVASGQHNDQILTDVLGYDAARIAELRDAGALG